MSPRKTWAIATREFGSFFVSPIVYVFLAVFLFLNGYLTVNMVVSAQQAQMNLTLIMFVFLVMAPLLTMKLVTNEREQGTIELVFTSPVRSSDFILGKFLAVLGVYSVAVLFSLEFPVFLLYVGDPDLMILATQFLGMVVIGSSFLAVGLFFSCLTENQIIAAVSSFCCLLLLWTIGLLQAIVPPSVSPIVKSFEIISRMGNFQQGILRLSDLVFFLSLTVVFLYASILYLNARSWQE